MTSQPNNLTKLSSSRPIQILPKSGANMALNNRTVPIQILNHSPALNLPMRTSGGAIVSDLNSSLPLQIAKPMLNVPLHMTSSDSMNTPKSSTITSNSFSGSTLLTAQLANLRTQNHTVNTIQLIPTSQSTVKPNFGDEAEKLNQTPMRNSIINSMLQKQDQSNNGSLQNKVQEMTPLGQLPLTGGQFQPPKTSSGTSVLQMSQTNNPLQVRVANRPLPPVLLVQTPGVKSTTDNTVTTPSPSHRQIILRRPQPPVGIPLQARQFVNIGNKTTTSSKCPILAPKKNPSFVLNTPKLSQNMVPVSVSSGKNPFSAYINQKKAITSPSQEDQPSISTVGPHISIPNSTSQKLVLAPVEIKKMSNAKFIFPSANSVINFQIANSQVKNDTHGSVTVMEDVSPISGPISEIPPLQPFSRNMTIANNTSVISSSSIQKSNMTIDNKFTSMPGTRVEPISADEYSLSIAETDALINDDVYTVSISESNDVNNAVEKSFTIPIPEKGKSLLSKSAGGDLMSAQCMDLSSSNQIPAILRRSNSDNHDKKGNNRRRMSSLDTTLENLNSKVEIIKETNSKDNSKVSTEQSRIPSLFCDEELDMDSDTKPTPVQVFNHINKDRRKSRVSSDIHLDIITEKDGDTLNFFSKIDKGQSLLKQKDKPPLDYVLDDAPGLQWTNGSAMLKGSGLRFHLNEFGLIDLSDNFLDKKSNRGVSDINGRDKKTKSPEDFYCCKECGCHGMAAEFLNQNFCSSTCAKSYERNFKYRKVRQTEVKKKRRMRKPIHQKRVEKEDVDANVNDDESHDMPFDKMDSADMPESKLVIFESNPVEEISNGHPWWSEKCGFSWLKYLEHTKAIAAPEKFFKEIGPKNCFKRGMKMEAIDPVHPSIYSVVTITDIQGHRLRLHFDGYHENYDFWVNSDSRDIFPAGWCEKTKRPLKLPIGFEPHNFSWNLYVRQHKAIAAPKNLFAHVSNNSFPTGFRVGMKLEAEDKKNSLTCVASISDIINNRILIHFDSWDDIYDYWVDPTSPYIHPVGWCDENGCSLTPPNSFKDPENFSWKQYLAKTESVPAPARAFKPRQPHKFEVGMKLEAVDKRAPFLIRVATVTDVKDYQIRISFDGWPDEYSYWVDDDCPDIHFMGWCVKTGHLLEPPLMPEDMKPNVECGTVGCQGFGNSLGAKLSTHHIPSECPYRLPAVSPVQKDRLDGARPPPQLSEPRPREPRKLTNMRPKDMTMCSDDLIDGPVVEESNERVPKRKLEDEIKSEVASDEESSSQSKIKRELSPLHKEKIEYSVYDPGYLPNPNRLAPVTPKCDFFPLKEIIQKESLRVDPREWNQCDVQRFVQHILQRSDFSWKFSKHRIDGESFLMLAQEDLVNIIGMKLGPAIKVYNSIVQLRQKVLS